jgi:hypothetical protein
MSSTPPPSLWGRLSDFASRNRKTILYTVGATTVLVTAGGVYYYYSQGKRDAEAGKEKRKGKGKKKKDKNASNVSEETDVVSSGATIDPAR